MILTVLEIVAPVFLLAAIGFAWVRMGFEYKLEFVTRLGTQLALPCLIFVALMETAITGSELTRFTLAVIAANAGVTLAFHLLVRLGNLDPRTFLSPLIFGNTGNLGLPLCLFAFGQAGLGYAVITLAVTALYTFTYGIYLFAGKGSGNRLLREPLVWATLLGALFLWQGWQTPLFLTNTLELIGQMAVPLLLITLGVAVARLTPPRIAQALWLSLVKLVVCVAFGWGLGLAFGLSQIGFGVLVVQMATPVAVTSYLLAERFGADADAVAGMVVVSTLLSVAAMPLILAAVL